MVLPVNFRIVSPGGIAQHRLLTDQIIILKL